MSISGRFWVSTEVAENYLQQSIGIKPVGNYQAEHHLGVLYLKRSFWQEEPGIALADATKGEEILRKQLEDSKSRNQAYACAALVTHKLRYLSRHSAPNLFDQLGELFAVAKRGLELNPFDEAVKEAHNKAYRAYLTQSPAVL